MEKILTLYHGSDKIVRFPKLNAGKKNNDYGQGFYCTEHYDLACEWACKQKDRDGFVNCYKLDIADLKVLDLTKSKYTILNWMTILLQNRTFRLTSPVSISARDYLIENFNIDISGYDIIKGYRADDSYFSFAEDFLNNTISVQHLAKAMKLGKLGVQYALISEKAFDKLKFLESKAVENQKYYPLYANRDLNARTDYFNSRNNIINNNDIFVLDMIREQIKNGDPRI